MSERFLTMTVIQQNNHNYLFGESDYFEVNKLDVVMIISGLIWKHVYSPITALASFFRSIDFIQKTRKKIYMS